MHQYQYQTSWTDPLAVLVSFAVLCLVMAIGHAIERRLKAKVRAEHKITRRYKVR
jgi:hypothetical protein